MKYLIIVFNDDAYEEYPLDFCISSSENIKFIDNNVYINDKKINFFEFEVIDNKKILLINDEYKKFEIGHDEKIDFQKDLKIKNINNILILKGKLYSNEKIFLNGKLLNEEEINLHHGDIIQINNIRLLYANNYIYINAKTGDYQCDLIEVENEREEFEGFPYFNRAPRLLKKIDDEKVSIVNPPAKAAQGAKGFFMTFLPTLLTCVVMVGLRLVIGNKGGMMMIVMSIGMCGVTLITNTIKYFSDKKENKKINKKRLEVYKKYLLDTRKKIYTKQKENKEINEYQYPSAINLSKMINSYNSRLYERSVNDGDFLTINVGYDDLVKQFPIDVKFDEVEIDKDSLMDEARAIAKEFEYTDNVPYVVDLKESHLGIIGNKLEVHSLLKNYIMQLTYFQSYHDLEMIMVFSEEYLDEFSYLKWYPHFNLKSINTRGLVYNEKTRDLVLGNAYQILKERENVLKENKDVVFFPKMLFIIDDPTLVINHPIYEYLSKENRLGISLIYTSDSRSKLLEIIKSIVEIKTFDRGTIINNNGEFIDKKLRFDNVTNINFNRDSRILASIIHEQIKKSTIPEGIGFLEMFGIKNVNELNIESRWNNSHIYKNIAVPVGVRAANDLVYLDLHEKAHGPHGLVAGTTGSGKSETIQTYILSLAVNFSPNEVGFLLIDYKGGGMANLFKNLPHLLGTITNLDGSEAMRALVSINSELKRRQRIFEQNNVNNINDYTKAFDEGKASEPLPHLFIISDEFAELKKEQPDFMKELVSTARVGRSLGVHLILATQKPAGVVDDQIWSNSKFKLCLKVQSEADSNEMLKTADAASITNPGRAYLQVGNNEIYELFQSAYSGATYNPNKEKSVIKVDNRVYLVNEIGQGVLLNDDLSEEREDGEKISELEAVINQISLEYDSLDYPLITKPWLPPLKTMLVNNANTNYNKSDELDLNIHIGMKDIPERQMQEEYVLNLEKDGVVAFYSAPGYGKSMFLTNIIINLCTKNSAKLMNIYIVDFGNNALMPLKKLNQVADYIGIDDEEKYGKLKGILSLEIKRRKKIIAQKGAQNFSVYNQLNPDDKLKSIVLIFDQFDILKEKGYDEEEYFSKIVRDGASLGIFVVMSVSRVNDIKYATANQIKNKIAGYLFDKADINQVVGRSEIELPDTKGRALVKDGDISLCQLYLPFEYKDEISFVKELNGKIDDINNYHYEYSADSIKVLPEDLYLSDLENYSCKEEKDVYLGLDIDSVDKVGFNLDNLLFTIIGTSGCGKTTALINIINQLKGTTYICDSDSMELMQFKNNKNIKYGSNSEQVHNILLEINDIAEERMAKFEEESSKEDMLLPIEFYRQFEKITVIIDDVDNFADLLKDKPYTLDVINDCLKVGINFICTVASENMFSASEVAKVFRNPKNGLVLGDCPSVNLYDIGFRDFPELKNGIYIEKNNKIKIKMLN